MGGCAPGRGGNTHLQCGRPLRGVAAAAGPPQLSQLPGAGEENNLAALRQLTKAGDRAAPSCRTHARSVGRAVSARALRGDRAQRPAWRGPGSPTPRPPWLRSHPGGRELRHLARAVSLPGSSGPGRVRANSCCQI